jgi:hypothetical protein
LAHLVHLGFAVITLEVELFFNSQLPEDMMIAAYAFLKSQAAQRPPQLVERNVRVRRTTQYLAQQPIVCCHAAHFSIKNSMACRQPYDTRLADRVKESGSIRSGRSSTPETALRDKGWIFCIDIG